MKRRDFFVVIAAPLFRSHIPTASLSVESVKAAIAEVAHAQLSSPCLLEIFRDNKWQPLGSIAEISMQMVPTQLGSVAREHWQSSAAMLMDAGEVSFPCTFEPMNGD
jgi:hypothetical protein